MSVKTKLEEIKDGFADKDSETGPLNLLGLAGYTKETPSLVYSSRYISFKPFTLISCPSI